jgi:hypothetical protein
LWQLPDDLGCGRHITLLGSNRCEGLHEVCVAIVLACVGLREEMLCGCEIGGELCAVAAIGAPGGENGDRKRGDHKEFGEAEPKACGHIESLPLGGKSLCKRCSYK